MFGSTSFRGAWIWNYYVISGDVRSDIVLWECVSYLYSNVDCLLTDQNHSHRPVWLVDGKRFANKIKSASTACPTDSVKWKSNPSRACPNCLHRIDNSDVRSIMPSFFFNLIWFPCKHIYSAAKFFLSITWNILLYLPIILWIFLVILINFFYWWWQLLLWLLFCIL